MSLSSIQTFTGQQFETFTSQPGIAESSSDDHSSPLASSQVSSCAVSRRTSIGPQLRLADDVGHVSTSESHENSIVKAKQLCGAEILNFEHLKKQLVKLTGQNKDKQQRQSDTENGNNTISSSPSCVAISSQAAASFNLPCNSSWPSGLDRTPSIESDVLLPADSDISLVKSAFSVSADNMAAVPCKCTGVELKPVIVASDPPLCASAQVDSLASNTGGQQMMHDQVGSHQLRHCQHCRPVTLTESLTQQTAVGVQPPVVTRPQLMNAIAGTTFSAFHQPAILCEAATAYCCDWQQPNQQSVTRQSQHPMITQYRQILHLQQQLQQHYQAVRLVQSTLHQSQCNRDMLQNAFAGPRLGAAGLPLPWQSQLTNLLMESGLSLEKSCEVVQQLQCVVMPTSSSVPLCAGSFTRPLVTSWSSVQVAYDQVVQLLSRPNPLITPELLESLFAQLPPPLNLNASDLFNLEVTFESLYTKYLELLMLEIGQLPITPVKLLPLASVTGVFGSENNVNKLVNVASVQSTVSNAEDKLCHTVIDCKQLGTQVKSRRTSYTGVDGLDSTCISQHGPLCRGSSLDLEPCGVPGAKVPGVPRGGVSCSRHQSLHAGNGAGKVSGGAVPRKNVDCPQGLADLDMALKEKLRPRTTKGVMPNVTEHTRCMTTAVAVVSSVSSTLSQSTIAPVTSSVEHVSVAGVTASNVGVIVTIVTALNLLSVTSGVSSVPKQQSVLVTKPTAAVVAGEKADAVKRQQVSIVRESVGKSGDISAADAAPFSLVKPVSSNICINITAGSFTVSDTAISSSQFRECAADHCLPSTFVSLPLLPSAVSDINRQYVSDSAIAATTTHLAQRHLQKKLSVTEQETALGVDIATRRAHSAISVSCNL